MLHFTYRLHINKELVLVLIRWRYALDGCAQTIIGQIEMWEAQHYGRICSKMTLYFFYILQLK